MLVAVVGYSLRFPVDIRTPEAFWRTLADRRVTVRPIADERWNHLAMYHPNPETISKTNVLQAGMIAGIDQFDSGFFAISAREANQLDPQQRMALEVVYEATEHGGIRLDRLSRATTGVFFGLSMSEYCAMAFARPDVVDRYSNTGGAASIAANRISHAFDLRGPSMAIDTACSSTVVALHQACMALQSGECDFAIAGGVNALVSVGPFIGFSKAGMMSPTGRCHVFSEKADGYVRSEGAGAMILRRLDQALADGDEIHGVIRATAVNNDGHTQGIALPNSAAQARLITTALERAELDPDQIAYVEAHGTGTQAGDGVECSAISAAIGKRREAPCLVGSVKGNVGHLEAAAGMPGLIKTIEALKHGIVPPTVVTPPFSSRLDFEDLNLRVVTEETPVPAGVAYMGVNSFGFGGTNAHAVLQTPPHVVRRAARPAEPPEAPPPLVVTARSAAALQALAGRYRDALETATPAQYAAVAGATLHRRSWHPHRLFLAARSPQEAVSRLAQVSIGGKIVKASAARGDGAVHLDVAADTELAPAFVFNGNGALWHGMGRDLFKKSRTARRVIEEVDAAWRRLEPRPLIDYFAAADADVATPGLHELGRADIGQPLLFAIQVAILRELEDRGIRVGAAVGHSVGEVAAAHASGALTLDDAAAVIAARGRGQSRLHGMGGMAVVVAEAEALTELIGELGLPVVVACRNSPRSTTLSGAVDDVEEAAQLLKTLGFTVQMLDVAYGFHTEQMDVLEGELRRLLATLTPSDGKLPFYSTVTGTRLDGSSLDGAYWWRNVRDPVVFDTAIAAMRRDGFGVFVEVGPASILRSAIRDSARLARSGAAVVPTLERGRGDIEQLDHAVARIAVAGGLAAWKVPPVDGSIAATELPRYPWQHRSHWMRTPQRSFGAYRLLRCHPLLGDPMDLEIAAWEVDFDAATRPVIDQHRFRGKPTVPAAVFLEMAVAASLRATSAAEPAEAAIVRVDGLEIRAGLSLDETQVQAMRTEIDAETGFGLISSRTAQVGGWSAHCRFYGELQATGELTAPLTWQQAKARCAKPKTLEDLYENLERRELTYGPAMRPLTRIRCGIDEATIEMDGAHQSVPPADGIACHIDPALLDACLQAVTVALDAREEEAGDAPRLPARIGSFRWDRGAGAPVAAHIKIHRLTAAVVVFSVTAYDRTGRVVFLIDEGVFVTMPHSRRPVAHAVAARLDLLDDGRGLFGRPGPALDPVAALAAAVQEVAADTPAAGDGGGRQAEAEVRAACVAEVLARRATAGVASIDLAALGIAGEPALSAIAHAALDLTAERRGDGPDGGHRWQLPPAGAPARDVWRRALQAHPAAWGRLQLAWQEADLLAALLDRTLTPSTARSRLVGSFAWEAGVLRDPSRLLRTGLIERAVRHLVDALPQDREIRIVEAGLEGLDVVQALMRWLPAARTRYWFVSPDPRLVAQAKALGHDPTRMVALAPEEVADLPADRQPRSVDLLVGHIAAIDGDAAEQVARFARLWVREGGGVLVAQPALDPLGRSILDAAAAGDAADAAFSRGMPAASWAVAREALADGAGTILIARRTGRLSSLQPISADRPPAGGVALLFSGPVDTGLAQDVQSALDPQGRRVTALPLHHAETRSVTETLEALLLEDPPDCLAVVFDVADPRLGDPEIDLLEDLRVLVGHAIGDAWQRRPTIIAVVRTPAEVEAAEVEAAEPAHPLAAAIQGFFRVLTNEHPELNPRSLRAPRTTPTGRLAPRLAELCDRSAWTGETEVVVDGERALALRFDRAEDETATVSAPAPDRYALTYRAAARLDGVVWQATEPGVVQPEEIEVQVEATACNFRDVMLALGLLPPEALDQGFAGSTLGLEFAGRVVRTGAAVAHLAPGDRVFGFARRSFASHVVTRASAVMPVPPGADPAALVTIPTVFLTALYGLKELARLEPGESVYIPGAAGGVGLAAIQVARYLGAEIYAAAGSPEKRDFLSRLGVNHVFDSRSVDVDDQVRAATGGVGVDVVLNSTAGRAIRKGLELLKPFGRFVELGKRDIFADTAIGLRRFARNASFFGVDVDQLLDGRPAAAARLMAELSEGLRNGTFHPLPHLLFPADAVAEALTTLHRARHIGKVVVTQSPPPRMVAPAPAAKADPPRLALRDDAVYLITGGLTGLGLVTARRFVARGARHLALVGRRGLDAPGAAEAVADLEAQGADIAVHAIDIGDATAAAALIEEIDANGLPLAGIVHAAGVLDDGLVADLTADRLDRVLRAKARGAWNLHQATRGRALDLFVFYSSFAVTIGNVGQANYAAANGFLDGLAAHRRAVGAHGLSIAWGGILDTGFLTRDERLREVVQRRMGGALLSSDETMDWLERLIAEDATHRVVAPADWRLIAETSSLVRSNGYRALVGDSGDMAADTLPIAELARSLKDDDLKAVIAEMVVAEVAKATLEDAAGIDRSRSTMDLGFDSLLLVELALAIERRMGVHVPPALFANGPSIEDLSARLLGLLRSRGGEEMDEQSSLASLGVMREAQGYTGDDAQSAGSD
ncbi:MAG: SDR family NAD(P)-dependent oxidoreductase [Rhodospirillaceae bacterium]|nr:SDR family NAD(P)-dependent oxidoreductase [Rhodospirillaceae bacterium]